MRVAKIEGTITLTDGSTSQFFVGTDGGWSQWGATKDRLGGTSEVLDVIGQALSENDLIASDYTWGDEEESE